MNTNNPNVQVDIVTQRKGDGVAQTKAELDQLNTGAGKTAGSFLRLQSVGSALRMMIGGLSGIVQGGAAAVRGFGTAIGGIITLLSSTVWGRVAQIAGLIATLGLTIVQSFRQSKQATDDLFDSTRKLDFGRNAKEWEDALKSAGNEARITAAWFERMAKATESTRRQLDEIADAELASKLAGIDLQAAQGKLTPEQAQYQRIELRRKAESDKIERERTDAESRLANIAEERAALQKQLKDAEAGVAAQASKASEALGWGPGGVAALELSDPAKIAKQLQERLSVDRVGALAASAQYQAWRQGRASLAGLRETAGQRMPELDAAEAQARTTLTTTGLKSQTVSATAEAQRLQAEAQAKARADAKAEQERAEQERAAQKSAGEREQIAQEAARARQQQAVGVAQTRVALESGDVASARLALSATQRAASAPGAGKGEQAALRSAQARFSAEQADLARAEAALSQAQQGNLDAINRLIALTGQALNEQRQQDRRISQLESREKTGARKTE